MLLKFYAQNYRSFKDGFEFSMGPVQQKELSFSIASEQAGSRTYKALSSGVIYGPHASGKTNIIEAMDTMRSIVLRGNIQDAAEIGGSNAAVSKLSLIPFAGAAAAPVTFGVVFVHEGIHVAYAFSMDVGEFLQGNAVRKIVSESLFVDQKEVFHRGETLSLEGLRNIRPFLNDAGAAASKSLRRVAESSLDPSELFLANGFKLIYSKRL